MILRDWQPKPHLRSQLSATEYAALLADERLRCYPLGEWTTRRQRGYLALVRWQLRHRRWNERLEDSR